MCDPAGILSDSIGRRLVCIVLTHAAHDNVLYELTSDFDSDTAVSPCIYIQCVQKKRDQNVFGNISDKPRAILMKFDTQFPE